MNFAGASSRLDIATYCSHAFADFLLGLVQFRPTPTSDEDIGAFFNEPRRLRR